MSINWGEERKRKSLAYDFFRFLSSPLLYLYTHIQDQFELSQILPKNMRHNQIGNLLSALFRAESVLSTGIAKGFINELTLASLVQADFH
jgi:hypothetical protein